MQVAAPVAPDAAVDALLHTLMGLGRRMRQRMDGESLDPSMFWLLKMVSATGPVRAADLALAANLDGSTVSRHVTQLEKAGLVVRTPDPLDGRAQLVQLSDHGREHLAASHQRRRDVLAAGLADWDHDDVATLQHLLTRFADAVESRLHPTDHRTNSEDLP